jgi:phage baseplate assembly protein W
MQTIGPQLPLITDSKQGAYSSFTIYRDEIKQNFKNLILTSPGERMMNPDFGVGMRHYLFEPNEHLIPNLRRRIVSQVKKYMPFIKINNIEFNSGRSPNDNPNMLAVAIEYEVPSMNLSSILALKEKNI